MSNHHEVRSSRLMNSKITALTIRSENDVGMDLLDDNYDDLSLSRRTLFSKGKLLAAAVIGMTVTPNEVEAAERSAAKFSNGNNIGNGNGKGVTSGVSKKVGGLANKIRALCYQMVGVELVLDFMCFK